MEKLAGILGVPKGKLEGLEQMMRKAGFEPAGEKVELENEALIARALRELGLGRDAKAEEVELALGEKAAEHDEELYKFLNIDKAHFDFHKVAAAASGIATEHEGFFLKKEYGEQILREREPVGLLHYLNHGTINEVLEREDVTEIFSALRFTESDEWMHKTFDVAYSKFTPDDFEKRPIEITVLGSQWEEVGKKYVAKKHHNVSHLKEFGVIFLNPIAQSGKGKFVRDFALLLHYFHEIAFYSRLFQKYAQMPGFNDKFLALLRGDVLESEKAAWDQWMLVQRYLWKEDSQDPRLFAPHVNPEAMHWRKAEQDLVAFGKKQEAIGLEFWDQYWAVAGLFPSSLDSERKELVSFDLEDNAMMTVHREAGNPQRLTYHQHEALWNKLFAAYVGGYDTLEEHIIANMEKGFIALG